MYKRFVSIKFSSITSKIKSYTLRSLQMGMISSPIKSNGVQIIGVNKEQEKEVTNLYTNLTEGSYFETKRKNAILIGEVLAKRAKEKNISEAEIIELNKKKDHDVRL